MAAKQWPRRPSASSGQWQQDNNQTQKQESPHKQGHMLGLNETGLIWLCYALYGLTFFSGALTAIVAVIINYVACNDQRESSALQISHMQWQISTFWRTVIYGIACGLISMVLTITLVGIVFVYPLWIGLSVWYIYRLARGVIALHQGRPI